MDNLQPADLVDTTHLQKAREELTVASARRDAALAALNHAQADLERKKAVPHTLFVRACNGGEVSEDEHARAAAAIPFAQDFVLFRRQVLDDHMLPMRRAAEQELRMARNRAHLPVLLHGLDLRLAAAETADKARGRLPGGRDDLELLSAAQADFKAATSVWIGFVQANCHLLETHVLACWPVNAAMEEKSTDGLKRKLSATSYK